MVPQICFPSANLPHLGGSTEVKKRAPGCNPRSRIYKLDLYCWTCHSPFHKYYYCSISFNLSGTGECDLFDQFVVLLFSFLDTTFQHFGWFLTVSSLGKYGMCFSWIQWIQHKALGPVTCVNICFGQGLLWPVTNGLKKMLQ